MIQSLNDTINDEQLLAAFAITRGDITIRDEDEYMDAKDKAIKKAMTRKVYRLLDYIAFIVKTWELKDDFVNYLWKKINQ